jgi:aspartate kinase
MNAIVQKYGGSSVADTTRIMNVAKRVAAKRQEGHQVLVVVSAMGKTTDGLIKLAKEISETPDPREMDMLLATGEQVSVALLSMALHRLGLKSKSLNAFQAGIMTTEDFNQGLIKNFDTGKLASLLQTNDVLVITGFQGVTEGGELVTLGRGGSDTSAVALAAALGIPCEIYSDVAGIYTVDPKLHPKAKKLKRVAYEEMLEMAGLGAKVLHSRSVEIAKKFGITIYCGSSFSDEEGSYVVDENMIIEQPVVSGLSVMDNQTQVTIAHLPPDHEVVADIFEDVAREGLNVDMISIINAGGELSVSFSIIEEKKKHAEAALKKILKDFKKCDIAYNSGFVKVSVVGIGMRSSTGVASRFFKSLSGIPLMLVTTSEIKISCLVQKELKHQAVDALVKEFEL